MSYNATNYIFVSYTPLDSECRKKKLNITGLERIKLEFNIRDKRQIS